MSYRNYSSNALFGIMMMIAAVGLFGVMSVMIKLIGPDYHPVQTTFFRNAVAAIVIIPFVWKNGGAASLATKRPLMHLARSLLGVAGNILYFYAFTRLALADVIVVSQAVPLFVTIIAWIFIREVIGWRRWVSVLFGFIGVLIAINPSGAIEIATIAAIIATVFWAITMLLMRSMGRTESPYTIAFYYMLAGALITACLLPWIWQDLSLNVCFLLLISGILGGVGQILMTYALKIAEASVVSPFNYTAILWGIIFDLSIWGTAPSRETLIGAIIITASGLYLLHRERIRSGNMQIKKK